jgi:restriction endonuclease S subunit
MSTTLLKQICTIKKGDLLPKNYKSGDYPIVGNEMYDEKCDQFNVLRGSIIIYRSGSMMGYVDRRESKTFVTTDCYYLDKIDDGVHKEYLYHYLSKMKDNLVDSAGPWGIAMEDLMNVKIMLPSFHQQEEFACRVLSRKFVIDQLKKQLEEIENKLRSARIESDEVVEQEMSKWIVKIERPERKAGSLEMPPLVHPDLPTLEWSEPIMPQPLPLIRTD